MDVFADFASLLLLSIAVLVIFWYLATLSKMSDIPGPFTLPFVGNALQFAFDKFGE